MIYITAPELKPALNLPCKNLKSRAMYTLPTSSKPLTSHPNAAFNARLIKTGNIQAAISLTLRIAVFLIVGEVISLQFENVVLPGDTRLS